MNSLQQAFENAKQLDPTPRGKAFEKVLGHMLEMEKIRCVLAYRPAGEEIDGAFWWNDHTFLIEAKWHKDPLPASSIYTFKGKVDGKFSGTYGVFISMSGYSPECVEALVHGKALNILLFDEEDIEAIIGNNGTKGVRFTTVLTEKLFAAGQTGNVYLPWKDLQEVHRSVEAILHRSIFIFCEGKTDIEILNSLLNYVASRYHLAVDNVRFVSADGKARLERFFEIPSLAQLITNSVSDPGAILVVLDEDARSMEQFLRNAQQNIPDTWEYHVAVAAPTIEAWIGLEKTSLSTTNRLVQLHTAIQRVDWGQQAVQIQELEDVLDFLKRVLQRR